MIMKMAPVVWLFTALLAAFLCTRTGVRGKKFPFEVGMQNQAGEQEKPGGREENGETAGAEHSRSEGEDHKDRDPLASAEDTKAPAEETKAPAEETKVPAEETKAPAEETKATTEETKAPAEEKKAPAEETKAPAEETKAPAEETKAPAEETKAPADESRETEEDATAEPAGTEVEQRQYCRDIEGIVAYAKSCAAELGFSVRDDLPADNFFADEPVVAGREETAKKNIRARLEFYRKAYLADGEMCAIRVEISGHRFYGDGREVYYLRFFYG